MSRRLEILTLLTIILLIGIPNAAIFYPPLFAGLAEQLPLETIFNWMVRIGILIFGFSTGWYLRERTIESNAGSPTQSDAKTPDKIGVDSVEGCIEIQDTIWSASAILADGKITTKVEDNPTCPECQTFMNESVVGWECDNCEHTAWREHTGGPFPDRANTLFKSEVSRIFESDGEPYSLDSLVERIDGEPTPRAIWEAYAGVVDRPHVRTDCFY